MSGAAATPEQGPLPEFNQMLGHPRPLWMLFMAEFWERFAFYGIRWALVLYIVAQFHGGDPSGQQPAGLIYGSYLALVYAGAIFGGYVADRYLGYQRSILIGAVIMAAGLFLISIANETVFAYDREQVRQAISGPVYGRSFGKYLMLRVEYHLMDRSQPFAPFNRISVEHVLPQRQQGDSTWLTTFTPE